MYTKVTTPRPKAPMPKAPITTPIGYVVKKRTPRPMPLHRLMERWA